MGSLQCSIALRDIAMALWNEVVETLDRRELDKLKFKRLKAVIKRVYEKIPFYRAKFKELGITPDDIRSLDDVVKLPFTTKDDLRSSYPYGLLAVSLSDCVRVHASSGTTGKPTVVCYTANDIENWVEVMCRCLVMSGLTKDDVFQVTPAYGLFTGGFGFHYAAEKIGALVVPTGAGNTLRQLMLMKDLGTTMIAGVASYALHLADVALQNGIDPAKDTKVRKGIFGAEAWSDSMRRKVAEIWNMDPHDIYGMSEMYGPGVACDCHIHDGLHVWEDHFLVEVVDPRTGEPLEAEEEGELVITSLTKEAMPLLRFRTRDLSRILDARGCDCGRTHVKIARVKGRCDDAIVVSGVKVFPGQIEEAIMGVEGVGTNYQLIVESRSYLKRLTVIAEASKRLSEDERSKLEALLRNRLKAYLALTPEVKVVTPLSLPRSEGKAKRIVVKEG